MRKQILLFIHLSLAPNKKTNNYKYLLFLWEKGKSLKAGLGLQGSFLPLLTEEDNSERCFYWCSLSFTP
jgi:hypothetical protein